MELAAGRRGVIHLEVGEPDLPTPDHIVRAIGEAAAAGHTRYVSSRGTASFRSAIADKVERVNGVTLDPEQEVVVTAGAANGLLVTLAAVVDPGDAVLVPDPGWPNYLGMLTSLGLRPVRYPMRSKDGFQPDVDAFTALAAASGARAVILNSPHNPTGTVMDPANLAAILEVSALSQLVVIADECYDQIVLDGDVQPSIDVHRTDVSVVNVYSLSKTYAMTGWRTGYVTGATDIIRDIAQVQETWLSCCSAPVQKAAEVALTGDQSHVELSVRAYRQRRDAAVAESVRLGLDVNRPSGAFYLMVDVSAAKGPNPVAPSDFARGLLERRGVAVAPGATFGDESRGFVRISLASEVEVITRGLAGIANELAHATS